MKKRFLAFLSVMLFVIGGLVGCGESNSTTSNTKEDVTIEDTSSSNEASSDTGLHEGMTIDEIMAHAEQNARLFDSNGPSEDKKLAFKISLDGKELTLPCKLQDLIDMGYQIDIALSEENKTNGYNTYLTNGDKSISVKLTVLEGYYETGEYRNYYYNVALYDTSNETNESVTNKWAICDVVGISLNKDSNVDVLLDDTISWTSTEEDVVAKYGELDSGFVKYYHDYYMFDFDDDETLKTIVITLVNINILEQE